ncbi:MAG TPA: HD domain-containing phosphohydrolase [Usitatibacteraceae bacterium]|nr:HD domain-containing phosphohydrolase [Usitatibacteraceae bacterium]
MSQPVHQDALQALNQEGTLRARVREIHGAVRTFMPFVARIAVAIYDPKTTLLKTFVHSSEGDNPLPHYQAPLGEVPSLKKLLEEGHPRVIQHMLTFEDAESEHAKRLGRAGYAASYTLPIFWNGSFLGFVFFNSRKPDAFTETALTQLDVFGHLVSLLVIQEFAAIRTLSAALESVRHIMNARDPETGSHLDRMSRYARLIAHALAERHGLDDDYVECIQAYAPLHDIGKIGIPDSILLKPASLTDDETAVMRTHSNRGQAMIDDLVTNFGLGTLASTEVVRNIALLHHERMDGKGYPYGLAGDAIPLEARIVAVADVFDALTSRRPYKEAYANDVAFMMIAQLANTHLDPECVQALVANRAEVERIQAQFREDPIG